MANEIWTIGSILKWTEQYFGTKAVESPRLDAEVLLSYVLHKERIYLYVHFDEPLEPEELKAYREAVKQRVQRVPVAYIIGQREFMGLDFKVTPAVLIPRPDTEILVQAAVDRLKKLGGWTENAAKAVQTDTLRPLWAAKPAAAEEVSVAEPAAEPAMRAGLNIADIGTGSGAVCLSILHYLPKVHAVTVDISPEAIAVAEENAASLSVEERITFLQGDLLAPVQSQQFAAIVSNPPYIPEADIAGLEPEVRANEPMCALAGGKDGLDFYRRLVHDGAPLLEPGGFLAFEVGIHQARAVAALAEAEPLLGETEILKDYAGIERVVVIWRK